MAPKEAKAAKDGKEKKDKVKSKDGKAKDKTKDAKPKSAMAILKERMAAQKAEEERQKEEEERIKREEEEEKKRQEEEEKRKVEAEKKKAEEERLHQQRVAQGKELSAAQKKKLEQDRKRIADMVALSGAKVEGMEVDEARQKMLRDQQARQQEKENQLQRQREEANRREELVRQKLAAQQRESVRAPICCVLGHVDTGKTKLLDKIRRTNVQSGEAGGITQQIGASFFPIETILRKTEELVEDLDLEYQIPGLLIIDTPGHESFTNLRSRGSGLCDIAILVIDVMHGLEAQTKESIQLLKKRNTPFIVALNKIDRLYDWEIHKDASSRKSLASQVPHVQQEFDTRWRGVMEELQGQGLNSALYWNNEDYRGTVSVVPTSAHTGEGIPDLLYLLTQLTQARLQKRITKKDDMECTVLEVKIIEGLGCTIDVILVNGVLNEGDKIIIGGINGPIITSIRSLLTPHPLRELRVKSEYMHHKSIPAAQGVKICASDLEHAVAGSQLFVVPEDATDDQIKKLKDDVDVEKLLSAFKTVERGVYVQASTLGSLEALLTFLKDCVPSVPVSSVNLGPVHKKDIVKASTMLQRAQKEYAVILAFDVPITRDAQMLADKEGVRIFTAEIIYHLFDQFTAYMKGVREAVKEKSAELAVFPVEAKILKVFRAKDPIVLGVEIVDGVLKVGTPVLTHTENGMFVIGKVGSIEREHKDIAELRKGGQAAVKLIPREPTITAGRQFNESHTLYSQISRDSIEALKAGFKDEMSTDDWRLIIALKKMQKVV